jgi:thiol-disulfide isomerase/thioredoxin
MKFKYLFLILLNNIQIVNAQKNDSSFVIKNNTGNQLNLYYHNCFYFGTPLDIDTKAQVSIAVNQPTLIINAATDQLFYKVQRGDKINYLKDLNIEVEGANKNFNIALNRLYKKGIRLRILSPRSYSKNINNFIDYKFLIKEETTQALKILSTINELDKTERKELEGIIRVSEIGFMLRPKYKLSFNFKDSIQGYLQDTYSSLTKIDYDYLVPFFDPANMILKYSVADKSSYSEKLNFIVNTYSKSKYRDFMIARIIIDNYLQNHSQTYENDIARFLDYQETKVKAIEFIVSRTKDKKIKPNDNSLVNLNKEVLSLDNIIKSQRTSLILLDCWASWCTPCIKEFKYSKELNTHFANRDFTIIYLSLDVDATAWKNGINANKDLMTPANSFLFGNSFESKFAIDNKITTIPRYILINKDGTIINPDAPRPSDPKLKTLIEKYLTK